MFVLTVSASISTAFLDKQIFRGPDATILWHNFGECPVPLSSLSHTRNTVVLCCLEIWMVVFHRGSAGEHGGNWLLIMAHHYSKASQAFYCTLKKSKDILWPLKLALVILQTHQGYSPVLLAAVHLYLSIPKVCQGPSHLRTLAHSVFTAWDTLHRTSCTALHMVGTISLFQYFLRRRSP